MIERGKLIITHRNDLPEPRAEDVLVVLETLRRVHENHPLFRQLAAHVIVCRLGVILRIDPRQESPLLLRHTEPLEGALHVLRHLIPALARRGAVRQVVAYFVEIHPADTLRGPVGRHGHLPELAQGLLAELPQPIRLTLGITDVINGLLREPVTGIVPVVLREGKFAARIDGKRRILLAHASASLMKSNPRSSICSTSS